MGAGAGAGAASGTTAPPRISRAGSRSSFAWSTNPIFKQADGAAAGDSPVSAVSPGGGGEGAGASGASPFHLHVSDVPVLPRLLPQHVEAARSGVLPSGLELTAQQRARVQTLVAAAQLELQHFHQHCEAVKGKVRGATTNGSVGDVFACCPYAVGVSRLTPARCAGL